MVCIGTASTIARNEEQFPFLSFLYHQIPSRLQSIGYALQLWVPF
jgi:hypothetical protein